MNAVFFLLLFVLWTIFWSFGSVLIYRLYSKEWGIINWRSRCSMCRKILKFIDLVPIFSFLWNLWKCRYCKKRLSRIYILLEVSTWILFALIWYFLIDINLLAAFQTQEIIKLMVWLAIWFITILYIFYDILFLEIHEWIMLFWIIFAVFGLFINTFYFPILPSISPLIWTYYTWVFSILICIVILFWLYQIMLKELSVFADVSILIWSILLIVAFKYFFAIDNISTIPLISWISWALGIFIFFYLQILLSKWKALWWWDLRIWIMVWLLLWISYSFAWMFLTYLVWSIISVWILITKKSKSKKKKVSTIIPFGPFIWVGFFLTIFFLPSIQKLIEVYFQIM